MSPAAPGICFPANLGGQTPIFSNYTVLFGVLFVGMLLGWLGTVIGSSLWGYNVQQVTQAGKETERTATSVPVSQDKPVELRSDLKPVAWLVHTRDCRWNERTNPPQAGDNLLPGQSLRLETGFAEVESARGAKILLEGPVSFLVESSNSAYLQSGRLAAWAGTPSSHGFTVRTPSATLIDEGTEFGVSVKDDKSAELQVFQGAVKSQAVSASGKSVAPVRYGRGDAVRFDGQGPDPKRVAFQPEQYMRLTSLCDEFDAAALLKQWTWDDPHHEDACSLSERPGWLRVHLGENSDAWTDDGNGKLIGRGGAPFLYMDVPPGVSDFTMETFVDLASAQGGHARRNSIGGLMVFDAAQGQFALSLGVEEYFGQLRVSLQSPGITYSCSELKQTAAFLKLRRDGSRWTAYYKTEATEQWLLLGSVEEASLAGGTIRDPRIGLLAKTWTRGEHPGGTAVDFDYFRLTWAIRDASVAVDTAPLGAAPQETAGAAVPDATVAKPSAAVATRAQPAGPERSGGPVSVKVSATTAPDVQRTFGATGKEQYVLNGYREAELLQHEGRGCLTHMWFGGDWPGYERIRLRVYVDGEQSPSIDMQMGLGHGCGFADTEAPWGSQKLGKTGNPSGIYNSYKIPFGKSIRVTAQRDRSSPDGAPFWWIVRGTENLPAMIAGVRLPEAARLKLYKLEQHVAKPLEEFDLCNVPGSGALYQVTIAGKGLNDTGGVEGISYLEACMRAYIDGTPQPLILSSGLEDYFLGTYYFNRGRYANGLAGLTHLDLAKREFSAYRFHDEDPVFFQHGLRLTCRCGELINGKELHKTPTTEFTTYTWVYQW